MFLTVPYSFPSEVTQAWNQEPPLKLAGTELIYQGEIRAWIEYGTGGVAMGGKVRQDFVVPTVLEDYLGALVR